MSTSTASQPAGGGVRVKGHSPWVWALRRTAYGLVILVVTIAGAAWLFNAAIDSEGEGTATKAHAAATKTPGKSAAAAQ